MYDFELVHCNRRLVDRKIIKKVCADLLSLVTIYFDETAYDEYENDIILDELSWTVANKK